ncbi:MAG: hypothetical protein NC305_03985 [Lachnospiraceae bacterium]|nr:hypothetical protein [Muribaculaceae bacterium]MCM1409691.1 hypothetical protein [Lachnospiraceae bacterium]
MELLKLVFSIVFGFFSAGFLPFFTPLVLIIIVCWVFYWILRLAFMRR